MTVHQFEGEPPIQEQVAHTLTEAGETLAVAESLTGGLVGALVTAVPGSSDFFDRSLVTYTYEAKHEELSVEQHVLEEVGAVNGAVAEQMARGAQETAGTTWGLSTTGIAGPTTNDRGDPVGTVYIGVVSARDGQKEKTVSVQGYDFEGSRSEIREKAARQALEDLYAMATA